LIYTTLLLTLGIFRRVFILGSMHGFTNAFGTKQQVDPISDVIGSAAGWEAIRTKKPSTKT
jgi:hypothetical protein